jgi:uncharacterized membrane protein
MQAAPPARDTSAPAAGTRLRFIDMARSIAILMMLEGHFVSFALSEAGHRPGWLPYDTWYYIRGLTAPIFFTVTGLVFSYLLCKPDAEERFFKITRVRKGLVRVAELFFWGYMIQLDLRRLPDYVTGNFGGWVFAFHVLQCIGAGLLVMIALFGLRRVTRFGATWMWFLAGAITVYMCGIWLASQAPDPGFPASAPAWVRNVFKGPNSVFPIAPWLAFTLYGATAGALIRHYERWLRGPQFPLIFIGVGLLMLMNGWRIDHTFASFLNDLLGEGSVRMLAWFHLRAGGALILIGVLMAWENFFGMRESRFLVIGRNTFSIYVIHVIVLYGGLVGYGVLDGIYHSLSFGQALVGAFFFMLAFAGYAQCVAPISARWRDFRAQKSR